MKLCRIGPCNTQDPDKMPLGHMVDPQPSEIKIPIGYVGDYDEKEENYEENMG